MFLPRFCRGNTFRRWELFSACHKTAGEARSGPKTNGSRYHANSKSWQKVRGLIAESKGDEGFRLRRRADAEETSRIIASLVARESDRRVAIWLRVRLGGERMTSVAADYGYRDGSGTDRVVQRLEEKATSDRTLTRHLKALAKAVSNVKS